MANFLISVNISTNMETGHGQEDGSIVPMSSKQHMCPPSADLADISSVEYRQPSYCKPHKAPQVFRFENLG
jgi:hypothetical protein